MLKKITITILILALIVAVAGYFLVYKKTNLKINLNKIEIAEMKMPFESDLGDLSVDTLDTGTALPSNLFSNIQGVVDITSSTK